MVACNLNGQVIKKNHFILGTGIALSGNNDAFQSGLAYDLKVSASLEYHFWERTSLGLKGGFSNAKSFSGPRTSQYHVGPMMRQYLFWGLNVQGAYLFTKEDIHIVQAIAAYSFYSGTRFIIEPYLEYGHEVVNKVNDDYLAGGIGLRFVL